MPFPRVPARILSLGLASVLASTAACYSPPAVPTPVEIFEPDPNHDFHAATGDVQINALTGHTVCYTTDGTTPAYANGTCTGGTTAAVPATRHVTIRCAASDLSAHAIVGVRLAFDWPGRDGATVQNVSGNFTLDCTQSSLDTDADGVPDATDNCPTTANADQADDNHNGIGNACESTGAPDADADGRPDTADNCLHVWNVNQADDDRDGMGNVCDPTPRGDPPLPWDNDVLARAFVVWKDEMKCRLNGCANPGGTGSWHTDCDGGAGTEDWNVSLSGIRAISTFTYHACQHTVMVNVHDYATDPMRLNPAATVPLAVMLVVEGQMVQDTDFGGSGNESGTVMVTGAFTGTIASHVLINSTNRAGGSYFSVSCSADPIAQEMCAPSNLVVNYVYPDWTCEPGGCPAPPPALTDRDGDGVFDPYDNCPDIANPTQTNADFDAEGDACDSSTSSTDTDRDHVPDVGDNCPMVANPGQEDTDHDGLGDACDPTMDPDTDADGIIDAHDNCPMVANPPQMDSDMDGLGDACDPTPHGEPAFALIKARVGRCLYDNGGDVRSTSACDAGQPNQRWEVIDAGGGHSVYRNLATMQCLVAQTWAGVIGMTACDMASSAQQWTAERYTQNGFDMNYPMRLHSAAQNYCVYTDGTSDVYASQGNCGLLGTENNRKIGIYPNGDFSAPPVQPP